MDFLNEASPHPKFKSRLNKKEPLNQSMFKFNNFVNNSKIDSSFSNNLNFVSGYSTIGNQFTEFSTLIGNPSNKQLEIFKTFFKEKNKVDTSLTNILNPENIGNIFDKKIKAFEYLEELDNLSDSEYLTRKAKIPKLDFSEIYANYRNSKVKIKIVKGLSTSSLSSKVYSHSSSSSKKKYKPRKKNKKKTSDSLNIKKGLCFRDYFSKNTEKINEVHSKFFEDIFNGN